MLLADASAVRVPGLVGCDLDGGRVGVLPLEPAVIVLDDEVTDADAVPVDDLHVVVTVLRVIEFHCAECADQ